MDTKLKQAASLGATVVGFLNHHVADLHAVSTAMQGLLAALPVNAETRASINVAIERVATSADNIVASLKALDALKEAPKGPTDDEAMRAMIADYLAKHPQPGPVAVQQDQNAATLAEKGAIMQASDRNGAQQMGGTAATTAQEPQDGTNRNEDAPVEGQTANTADVPGEAETAKPETDKVKAK